MLELVFARIWMSVDVKYIKGKVNAIADALPRVS